MQVSDLIKHSPFELDAQALVQIGTHTMCSPSANIQFLQLKCFAKVSSSTFKTASKIIISGFILSNGVTATFERSFTPSIIENEIKVNNKFDQSEFIRELDRMASLVQRDIIANLVSTLDPIFRDKAFFSWWGEDATDGSIIQADEVAVAETTAIEVSAFTAELIKKKLYESLNNYYQQYLQTHLSTQKFEKSFCESDC